MDGAFDFLTKTGVDIDLVENKINTGQMLYGYSRAGSLAIGGEIDFFIKTDVNWQAHLYPQITMNGNVLFNLYKFTVAPTVPTSPLTIYRYKYQIDKTANAKTKIYGVVTGGTSSVIYVLDNAHNLELQKPKHILEPDSWYRLQYINNSGAIQAISMILSFFEVDISLEDGQNRDNPDL